MPATEQEPTHGEGAIRPRLLQPGRNCWRIERAQRFSLLVDGADYFRAVRAAIRAARRRVFILSWDIDSRTLLVPGGANDGFPEPLGEFLHAMVDRRPGLDIHVLNWDFAMLYALEREWMPVVRMNWRKHPRLHFHMDGRHPVGASHHQKIVVIDDRLAFVGGLDLTRSRWDTAEHACDNPLRCDPDGKRYDPFHDVQAMVDGQVARALGELARERWYQATGRRVPPASAADANAVHGAPGEAPHDPWPEGFPPDLTDIDVGIARTAPAYEGRNGIHEVQQLHLDAIAAAQKHLFFENQYFTSDQIGRALAARLSDPDGPEVMVVSPRTQSGWLEEATMGALRVRVHQRLKQADGHGRYRLYCPILAGLKQGCLNVHSKVFAVDDRLFVVGSANLSNRSMVLDTECNLVIEAAGDPGGGHPSGGDPSGGDPRDGHPSASDPGRSHSSAGDRSTANRISDGIARLRARLLSEHLGAAPEAVMAEIRASGSLHRTAEKLGSPERTLMAMDPALTPESDALLLDQSVFDPERPIAPEEMVAQLVPKDARRPVPRRLIGLGSLALLLALLAVAWRWTPLREYVNLASLVALARGMQEMPFTPLVIVASYVIAGCLMVPVMLLIAVTGIVFGPVTGALYAVAGTLLSAAVTYFIGRWLGRDTVRSLMGPRVNRLSRHVAKRGILAMMVIRILPVAPYTVVNVVAGASHIRFRDYLIGTFLGMAPGILITVTFVHHLAEAVRNPSAGTIAVLAGVALFLVGFAILLQRLLAEKGNAKTR